MVITVRLSYLFLKQIQYDLYLLAHVCYPCPDVCAGLYNLATRGFSCCSVCNHFRLFCIKHDTCSHLSHNIKTKPKQRPTAVQTSFKSSCFNSSLCFWLHLDFQPTCHLNPPPPPDTEPVISCFSISSCFFFFLSTASGFLTPLYVVSFCLFSAASANCRLLASGSGVTTTSSAAPPRQGKHIPILEYREVKGT